MSNRIIWLLAIIILVSSVFSRANDIRFDHLNVQENLPTANVKSIIQDHIGFMWFGTENGLCRYDGCEIKVYKYDPSDKNSLRDNEINCLYLDKRSNLWIGTLKGLSVYVRDMDYFKHYMHDSNDSTTLSHDHINSIFQDSNGDLWIGTEFGLNRFNYETGKFKRFGYDCDNVHAMCGHAVTAIAEDFNGNLWFCTWRGGMNKFNRLNETFTRFQHDPNDENSLSSNAIESILVDENNQIWIGTFDHGLNRYDPSNGSYTRYFDDCEDGINKIRDIRKNIDGNLCVTGKPFPRLFFQRSLE